MTPAVAYLVASAGSLTPGSLAALFLPYCLGGIVWLLLGLVGIQAGLRARKGLEFSGLWLVVAGVLAVVASIVRYGAFGIPGIVGGAMLVAAGAGP